MIRVGSADALGSRVLAPRDQARDLLSEETWPKNVPHSFLGSAYLSEATRMSWEGIPHHTEGTSEDTKIGPLFLCVVSGSKVTARRVASLQLVLLEEDLCIHSAAGDTFGSAVWFDQLQFGIRQVFLGNLWLYGETKAKDNDADHSQLFYHVLMDQVHVCTVLIG